MIIDFTALSQYGEKVECTFKYDGIDGEEVVFLERTFHYRNVKILAKRAIR